MSGGLLLPGSAQPGDVLSGQTFSSEAGFNQSGTLMGNAYAACPQISPLGQNQPSSASWTMDVFVPIAGQPLIVAATNLSSNTVSSITDTFSTAYTWTKILREQNSSAGLEFWIGTGGNGTYGSLTVNLSASYFPTICVVPTMRCSTASGLSAVDASNSTYFTGSGTNNQQTLSLSATASIHGVALAAAVSANSAAIFYGSGQPWMNFMQGGGGYVDQVYMSVMSATNPGTVTASWQIDDENNPSYVVAVIVLVKGT